MSEQEFSAKNTAQFAKMDMKTFTPETDGLNPHHMGVIRPWGAAILRGEPLIADGREGINGLMLSNAMHMSDWLGKAVELPLDEDLYYEELMKRVKTSRRKTTEVKAVVADMDSTYGSKISNK